MNQPLVSIIIPTYNRADLIEETLDSIVAQTYTNWECIVVDDGSTDHTAEVLKKYIEKDSRIQYHHRPDTYKAGGNGARNYGFDISKGEYVNWFDSDDIMDSKKIEVQLNALISGEYNYCVCQTTIFENTLDQIIGLRSELIDSDDNFFDYLTQKNVWLTNAAFWKKKFILFKRFRFNENLKAAQEWEFNAKVLSEFLSYSVVNQSLVLNRKHDNTISYHSGKQLDRKINYLNARKFVLHYLYKNKIQHEAAVNYLHTYIERETIQLMKTKDFKALNQVIFYNGYTLRNLYSFFTIYFFLFTNRLKSKMRYV